MDCFKILDNVPILMYINSPNGIEVTFYNKTWYKYTGFTQEEMKDGWDKVIHPADLQRVKDTINSAVEKQEGYEIELRILNKNTGIYKWYLSRANPIFNEKGEIDFWVGTSTDVNSAKRSNELAEEIYHRQINERMHRIQELEEELKLHKTMN